MDLHQRFQTLLRSTPVPQAARGQLGEDWNRPRSSNFFHPSISAPTINIIYGGNQTFVAGDVPPAPQPVPSTPHSTPQRYSSSFFGPVSPALAAASLSPQRSRPPISPLVPSQSPFEVPFSAPQADYGSIQPRTFPRSFPSNPRLELIDDSAPGEALNQTATVRMLLSTPTKPVTGGTPKPAETPTPRQPTVDELNARWPAKSGDSHVKNVSESQPKSALSPSKTPRKAESEHLPSTHAQPQPARSPDLERIQRNVAGFEHKAPLSPSKTPRKPDFVPAPLAHSPAKTPHAPKPERPKVDAVVVHPKPTPSRATPRNEKPLAVVESGPKAPLSPSKSPSKSQPERLTRTGSSLAALAPYTVNPSPRRAPSSPSMSSQASSASLSSGLPPEPSSSVSQTPSKTPRAQSHSSDLSRRPPSSLHHLSTPKPTLTPEPRPTGKVAISSLFSLVTPNQIEDSALEASSESPSPLPTNLTRVNSEFFSLFQADSLASLDPPESLVQPAQSVLPAPRPARVRKLKTPYTPTPAPKADSQASIEAQEKKRQQARANREKLKKEEKEKVKLKEKEKAKKERAKKEKVARAKVARELATRERAMKEKAEKERARAENEKMTEKKAKQMSQTKENEAQAREEKARKERELRKQAGKSLAQELEKSTQSPSDFEKKKSFSEKKLKLGVSFTTPLAPGLVSAPPSSLDFLQPLEPEKPVEQEWTEEEVFAYRSALRHVAPTAADYWREVSRLVGSRSAAQCQERQRAFNPTPPPGCKTKSKMGRSPESLPSGKKAPLKRKRVLRRMLEAKLAEAAEDDELETATGDYDFSNIHSAKKFKPRGGILRTDEVMVTERDEVFKRVDREGTDAYINKLQKNVLVSRRLGKAKKAQKENAGSVPRSVNKGFFDLLDEPTNASDEGDEGDE